MKRAYAIAAIAGLSLVTAGAASFAFRTQIVHAYQSFTAAPSLNHGHEKPGVLYTCSMHPQVIQDHPGLCPICHMPLTPVTFAAHDHAGRVTMDPVIVQNMGVRVAQVRSGALERHIRTVGTFTEPDQNHVEVNLRVSGWIEKLYANKEGMAVNKGDRLFDLYSPEITAAAEEMISARPDPNTDPRSGASADAAEGNVREAIQSAARRKLELLGLTSPQIDAIAKLDKAPRTVAFFSPITGHVASKMVSEGAAVKAGDKIMIISDLTSMWLQLQVYEQDLGGIAVGTEVKADVAAFPGKTFTGKVDFIYPHLDMMNRTATVRVVFENHGHRLREGMYAAATIDVRGSEQMLTVPREAVIDSGTRQTVFVSEGQGHFSPRDVEIGITGYAATSPPIAQGANPGPSDPSPLVASSPNPPPDETERVQILAGLKQGETVVTSGQFLLDSESRRQEAFQKMLAARLLETSAATEAVAPQVDPRVDSAVAAYLDLSEKLGGDPKGPLDTAAFETAATDLAKQLKDSPEAAVLASQAAALKGLSLEAQRAKFKDASAAVLALIASHMPSNALGVALYQFRCPMNKGDWLQRSDKLANPFYGDMKDCGSLVKPIPLAKPDQSRDRQGATPP